MSNTATIPQILKAASDTDVALSAPGQSPLTHAQLRRHIEAVVQQFAGFGIGRGVRVAIVLPNGLEVIASFLAVTGVATAAPLNAAYKPDEFEFYLDDTNAKAVITGPDAGQEAVAAAPKGAIHI